MATTLIVIGTSWGGLNALKTLFPHLPRGFSLPVAVAIHRLRESRGFLVDLLQKNSALPVMDAEDKMPIEAGHIYLAPADYHLLVEGEKFSLSVDRLVRMARPSVDVLFESCADVCGEGAIGVILTGGRDDGARGLARILTCGGTALVQNPETAENPAMPRSAIKATETKNIYDLPEIGKRLCALDAANRNRLEREIIYDKTG
ncbi:MAG: chemotaxis protein CheB [Proteobacteria bacterium]|nr:chemotaxis protein CheB [Pseudomonadota bacterium]